MIRHSAEQDPDRLRTLLRLAGQVTRFGTWEYDRVRDELRWSDVVAEVLGIPRERVITLGEVTDLSASGTAVEIQHVVRQCLEDGVPFETEVQVRRGEGRRWVRVVGEPVRDEDGAVVGALGGVQDIDQRRHGEIERRQLAERLTGILSSITDAVLTIDREWRYTYVNQHAADLMRRDRRSLMGRRVWDEYPALRGTEFDEVLRRVAATGRSETIEEFHYAPYDQWFELRVYPFDDGVTVYFRDVTERREARLELHRREQRMREQAELLDKASDAIIVRDVAGPVTYWNPSAEALYGWASDDVLGRRVQDALHADSAEHERAMAELLRTGEWVGELQQVGRDGRELRVEARWTLMRGDDGEATSVLEIVTDVTERRAVEQQVLRARRLESLGTLASGIAHDLNNALSPVLMAVQLLRDDLPRDQREEILDLVEESTRHGADLVQQVLGFARGVDGQRLPVDVDTLVTDVARLIRDTFPPAIRWHSEVADGVPHVEGDATQLYQVLVNLCVNARDAMPDGGELRVRVSRQDLAELPVLAPADAEPGTYVRVEVVDTGQGMPPEVLDRAFEPFFTTKDTGAGTGLGLSTSLAIIESHRGFVEVTSAAAAGTRFVIHLPASSDRAIPAPPVARGRTGRGELILVVEDQPGVRHSTARALQANGYTVVVAADGEEAVATFADRADEIDLVLTDMMMPGIDGAETVRRIREARPDVPAVITSGLVEAASDVTEQLAVPFLSKPYGTRALLDVVGTALGRPGEESRRPTGHHGSPEVPP